MRVTKYIHSCLLIECGGEKLLFDPGKFSFVEGLVKPEQFGDVNWIVLTHGHPDHLDLEEVKRIREMSGASVIGNAEVAEKLRKQAVAVVVHQSGERTFGAFHLHAIEAKHQPILADELPANTAFVVNGKLLNGGDSFDHALEVRRGIEVLAVPVLAPYLTELHVMDYVKRMQPKQVVPVHDGYAKDFFINQRYENYETNFRRVGIKFHWLAKAGDSVAL